MIKRIGCLGLILVLNIFMLGPAHLAHASSAEAKAKERHELATSDFIYSEVELQALYYQNLQIIQLLKDIKSLLQQSVELESKDDD